MAEHRGTTIPEFELDLPVSIDPAGHLVTLRELLTPGCAAAPPPDALRPEQLAELAVRRIEGRPRFQVAMFGAGLVDRERAVREVRADTPVGRALVEIEQLVVRDLLAEVGRRSERD